MSELKRRTAEFVASTASGAHALIQRLCRVFAQLGPVDTDSVHVGARSGRGRLVPLLRNATSGRYLAVLADDRGGGADR